MSVYKWNKKFRVLGNNMKTRLNFLYLRISLTEYVLGVRKTLSVQSTFTQE